METIPLSPSNKRSKLNCCPSQENDGLRVIVFCFGVLCICVTIALVISIYLGEPEVIPRGAVATDSQQCSQIGVDILKKGGNAVDAAISSMLCMCVVNPHITSIGGGGAMIILNHLSSKPPTVINFQDSAPSLSIIGSQEGASSVGIPGLLNGLWESHQKFGKLEWAGLIQPSIDLSQYGINVSSQLAAAVQNLPQQSPLRQSQLFFPNNIPLAENQVIKQPSLASVLVSVAKNGASDFYSGPVAKKLVNFMKKFGAEWTMEDLQNYRARIEPAISGTYGKTTLYTSSAPTSGPQLISLLNILSGFNLGLHDQLTLPYIHQLVEAMRITEKQITKLGDPVVVDEVRATVADMINKTLSDEVRKQILPDAIIPVSEVPELLEVTASVVSVIDNEDLYVSIVSGLNSMFGSQLEASDGFLLNNALANFYGKDTGLPNAFVRSGQRPLQGILPVIATESNSRCGTRIVSGSSDSTHLGQVIMNLLQFNQTVLEGIRSPRIQTQAQSIVLSLEDTPQARLPDSLIDGLKKMGHSIKVRHPPYPSINVVLKKGDALASESDGRGGGHSVKYGP